MTEAQYKEYLGQIKRANPKEPLLEALRGGYSPINVVYMKSALKRMEKEVMDEPEEEEQPEKSVDETLNRLYDQKRRLFGQMNQLSNKFHGMRTDNERRENSERIMAVWSEILEVKANISYYQEHGKMPEKEEERLPDDAVGLMLKINAIRVNISTEKKKLEELASLDPKTPKREEKIQKAEQKLAHQKHLLGLAIQKRDVLSEK